MANKRRMISVVYFLCGSLCLLCALCLTIYKELSQRYTEEAQSYTEIYEQIDSTSFIVFGIGFPRSLCPFSVIRTLSSIRMPPIDI